MKDLNVEFLCPLLQQDLLNRGENHRFCAASYNFDAECRACFANRHSELFFSV